MNHIVLLMSIGPGSQELIRLHDFFAGVFCWEPAVKSVVLIDDSVEPRGLSNQFVLPAGVSIHSVHHPRKGAGAGVWGALTEGVLLGLDWIAIHEPHAAMVLKVDTDALVIGPFHNKAAKFFEAHPSVGLIGLHDRHCSGERRSFQPWDRATLNYSLPVGTRRTATGGRRLRWQLFNAHGVQRRIFRQARARGYVWGEHCLGGAYLLRAKTVQTLHAQGFLRHASFWRDSLIGEDVIVGAYVKSSGWDMASYSRQHEIFGIAYIGLPALPENLEASGYSIIHSVKNDSHQSEEQIRSYFRNRRMVLQPNTIVHPERVELNTSTGIV